MIKINHLQQRDEFHPGVGLPHNCGQSSYLSTIHAGLQLGTSVVQNKTKQNILSENLFFD